MPSIPGLSPCAVSCCQAAPPARHTFITAGRSPVGQNAGWVQLAGQEEVSEVAIRYLNRLSDWFFVAARAMNAQKDGDVLWVPGAGRG